MPHLRVPKGINYPYDLTEIPLVHGPSVSLSQQWTMTVLTDPKVGFLLAASVYNGNYVRGTYFFDPEKKTWKLTMFDYPHGQDEQSPDVLRRASLCLSRITGCKITVTHSTELPQRIGFEDDVDMQTWLQH